MALIQIQNREGVPVKAPWSRNPAIREAAPPPDSVNIEQHRDVFLVSKPSVGALSVLDETDLVAFHLYYGLRDDPAEARRVAGGFFASLGYDESDAQALAGQLVGRLERDGWTRADLPKPHQEPLHSVYFTLTRRCDLACPYCYQGLADRHHTEMTVDQAKQSLDKIKAVNPNSKIIVTGGEPFAHPDVFEILREVDARDLRFVILTNGTHINQAAAEQLKSLKGLLQVQMSLDGITEETHGLTRGRAHFHKAIAALDSIIAHELPFVLAPTMHDGNLHELYDISALAIAHGGWCSPNNLRQFPHEGLNFEHVHLSNDRCLEVLGEMNRKLVDRFGLQLMAELAGRYKGPSVCSASEPNTNFICGMAYSLIDLDWNGDVYPCHLSKGPELVIGNLFVEDFDAIFQRVKERGIRVESHEIPKCSHCKFVSTCGGGCRAGAWFAHGSLAREDGLCDLNYNSKLQSILIGAASWYPTAETGLG